jgi:ABC-2 type transport system permease protein
VMIQPRLVLELARKDLQLFLADRKGVLLCFGVPILLASAFGAIFHRPDDCRVDLSVQVVAQDDGPLTRSVVKALCSCERLQASPCDLDAAQRRLATESGIFIVLPPEFSQLSKGVNHPRVKILHHPRNQVESKLVEGILTEIVIRESAREWLGPLAKIRPELLRDRPFAVERLSVPASGALSTNAYSHSFCGMTLQYLLFWGMDSGLLLLRERKQGIWQRLRAAPLTETTLICGKALATALIALAQIASTFAFGALFFGVTVTGSVVGFVLMVFAASLLSATTGLLVAAVGGNESRARSVAILVILTLSLLGGLWLPSFLLPAWVQKLAMALPTTWAARGLEGVTWQGMGLASAWPCAVALLGFSVAFLVVAWWRLSRSERING